MKLVHLYSTVFEASEEPAVPYAIMEIALYCNASLLGEAAGLHRAFP